MSKIIFIGGNTPTPARYERLLMNHDAPLKSRYPEAEVVYKTTKYLLYEVKKTRVFGEAILAEEDTSDEEVILIGHSTGGIIACGIANKFQRSRVVGVVTIFTAQDHQNWFYPNETVPEAPIISIGGLLDPFVWHWRSRHRFAQEHATVVSDHLFLYDMLLNKRRVFETIAEIIAKNLPMPSNTLPIP